MQTAATAAASCGSLSKVEAALMAAKSPGAAQAGEIVETADVMTTANAPHNMAAAGQSNLRPNALTTAFIY